MVFIMHCTHKDILDNSQSRLDAVGSKWPSFSRALKKTVHSIVFTLIQCYFIFNA